MAKSNLEKGDDDVTKSIKFGLDHHTDTNIELKQTLHMMNT